MRLLAFFLIVCVTSLASACRSSSSSDQADQRKDLIGGVQAEDYEDDLENEDDIEDEDIPDDERTMTLFQTIANTIHPSMRVTIDYPSKHEEKKVPKLDVQMWIDMIENRMKLLYKSLCFIQDSIELGAK